MRERVRNIAIQLGMEQRFKEVAVAERDSHMKLLKERQDTYEDTLRLVQKDSK